VSVNPHDRARRRRAAAAEFLLACSSLLVLTPLAVAAPATLPPPDACVDGGRSTAPPDDEGKDPGLCSSARLLRQPLVSGGEAALLELDSETDVTHYLLDLELIPEYSGSTVVAVRVEGVSTVDFEPTADGRMTFTLDLHSGLTVNSVTGDVDSWSRVGNTIEIQLDRSYDTGESVQVAVDYEGYPVPASFGAFKWWLRNGELVIATLSEPFYARYWWPCKDALDDKATLQMWVTVPSDLVAFSNGSLTATEALPGSRTQYRWHEQYPMIPYLASLAVTSYESYELQYDYEQGGVPGSMPVSCHFYPDHWDSVAGEPLPDYKQGCDELPDMLETFSGLFGLYPWIDEKYDAVETGGSGGLGASMEHQTISSMWRINSYSDIMAHELAHQWWGDEITCETWYDIWINEGFASYSESLYREFRPGGSVDSYWIRVNGRRPFNPDAQVYRTSISTTGAIFSTNDIYNKGSWVLHMLRHVLGDESFFAALADYRAQYGNDSATVAEFASTISGSFGEDLTWFTDQWVMNPGSPDYEWNYSSEQIGGQELLKLAIWQTQNLGGYGLFTMPIDIRVTTASTVTVHTVWNDDWSEYYVLPVDGPVLAVEFDEDAGVSNRNWILWNSSSQVATALDPPPVLLGVEIFHDSPSSGQTTLVFTFSEDIGSFDPSDVALAGSGSGAHVPISWSYDAGSRQATLTYAALPADDYTFTILSAGISANGKALDGETDEEMWWDQASLPSGDGQPGGDAVLDFSVEAVPIPAASPPARILVFLLLAVIGARRPKTNRRTGGFVTIPYRCQGLIL
jgi:hypothetical protein